jgi:hypothetical protein
MTPEHPLARLEQFRPTGLQPDARLTLDVIRVRLAGRPYLARPHLDGRPGYALTPDRAQRFADRQETMTP